VKKEIAFIDHNFHKKSRSADFLRKIYKKNYRIKNFWWSLKDQYQLINKIENYNNFFFFQSLLPLDDMIRIKDKNIIWAPMYDNLNLSSNYWRKIKYLNIKILSFSKPVKKLSKKYNCDHVDLEYALNTSGIKKVNRKKIKIFFWFRNNFYTKDWIKLFNKDDVEEITYFKCPDPGRRPEKIKDDDLKNFNFKIIDKDFLPKKTYLNLIKNCDVFISPRKQEGIGMSFLEALSMGKYIIANNDSTMNEYIKNNKIGFLVDQNTKKKINISEIIKSKTYRKINARKIFIKWNKDKKKILKFSNKVSSNKNNKYLKRILFFDDYLKKIKFKIKN
jgi:glycosyltransferase involved in cell wall biosynthesis